MLFANPDTSTSYVELASCVASWRFRHRRWVTVSETIMCKAKISVISRPRYAGRRLRRPAMDFDPRLKQPMISFDRTHAAACWWPCCWFRRLRCADGVARGVRGAATVVARSRRRRSIPRPPAPAGPGRRPHRQWLRVAADRRATAARTSISPTMSAAPGSSTNWRPAYGSSRTGRACNLAARVVLPRTIDPRSGRPVTTILTGPAYTDVGRWQQLQIDRIPTLLTRQVQSLRMQLGPQVDEREAYRRRRAAERLRRAGGDQRLDRRSRRCRLRAAVRPRGRRPGSRNCRSARRPPTPAMPLGCRFRSAAGSRVPSDADRRLPRGHREAGRFAAAGRRPADVSRVIQHRGEPLAVLEEDRVQRRLAATSAGAGVAGRGRSFGAVADLPAAAAGRRRAACGTPRVAPKSGRSSTACWPGTWATI